MGVMSETILVVDDEESVRRTFVEWLAALGPDVQVYTAADAATALHLANQTPIDLAILDWNLGSGTNGLQLLEDLAEFQPDITAILVTGFADQATPLDALRLGVRDYFDKTADLTREAFLATVRRQLARIRPLKRHRELHQSLLDFRSAVEQVLPLVQGVARWQDAVPVPAAVRDLLHLAVRATQAGDGFLVVHRGGNGSTLPSLLIFDRQHDAPAPAAVPFRSTLAAAALAQQAPLTVEPPQEDGLVQLLPPEQGRRNLLVVPLTASEQVAGALELADKSPGGFTTADREMATLVAEAAAELLRRALAEQDSQRLLLDALAAALQASERLHAQLDGGQPAETVLQRLQQSLMQEGCLPREAETLLPLLEDLRRLSHQYGPAVVAYCAQSIASLRRFLEEVFGQPPPQSPPPPSQPPPSPPQRPQQPPQQPPQPS